MAQIMLQMTEDSQINDFYFPLDKKTLEHIFDKDTQFVPFYDNGSLRYLINKDHIACIKIKD